MLQCQFESDVICVNLNVVSRALGLMESVATFQPAVSEVANTKSHQAGVTKILPHENACREQRSKSVQNTNNIPKKIKSRYSDMDGSSFISIIEVSGNWKVVAIHYYPCSNFF